MTFLRSGRFLFSAVVSPIVLGLVTVIVFCWANVFAGNDQEASRPEWEGNTLGLEDKVLCPWSPVEVEDDAVRCWGRAYQFSGSALPRSIVSAGKEILSRPAELRATLTDGTQKWSVFLSKVELSSHRTRAVASGAMIASLGSGETVHINTRVSVEYDGLVQYQFSIPDGEEKGIARLVIDIPVSDSVALYRHRFGWDWKNVSASSGKVPRGIGVVERTKFIPFYWLGDDERGIFWFCESDETWPNSRSGDAIQIVRAGREVVLRLIVKRQGQALPRNWRFAFGLQATPVKPLREKWRSIRLAPATGANVGIIWPTPTRDSLLYYGYPEAADDRAFAKRIRGLEKRGVMAVPYLCLSFLSMASPEWKEYSNSWATSRADESSSDVRAYGAPFAMVSPAGKGWSDFVVWKTKRFMDRYGITGVYHDNSQPHEMSAPAAGVGYMRDGKPQPTYPILAQRALYRRMYSVIRGISKSGFMIAHTSSKLLIPVLAYEDAYLDGEQFAGVVKDNYMDVVSLDEFRSEFVGKQWGLVPVFLPEFRGRNAVSAKPTRGLMTLLMLHDVLVWPQWCNVSVVNDALRALDMFGYADATFVPYHAPNPVATTDLQDVYVSAYRRDDGAVLLIVGNLGRTCREGRIELNKSIQLDKFRLINWPDGQELQPIDNSVQVKVDGQAYRMLVLTVKG